MCSSMLKKANMLMLTILHLLRISEITLKPKVKVMEARPVWLYWTQGDLLKGYCHLVGYSSICGTIAESLYFVNYGSSIITSKNLSNENKNTVLPEKLYYKNSSFWHFNSCFVLRFFDKLFDVIIDDL